MEENQAAAIAESAWLKGQNRLRLVGLGFALCFTTIAAQLGILTLWHGHNSIDHTASIESDRLPRPDIVDRNGVVLATDIAVASLYADPRKILDVDEAVELPPATLPDPYANALSQKLLKPN